MAVDRAARRKFSGSKRSAVNIGKKEESIMSQGRNRSDLGSLPLESVEDGLVG